MRDVIERTRSYSRPAVVAGLAVVIAFAAACGGSASTTSTASASALPWENDLQQALDKASAQQKLVMVDFYAEWCMWCKKLDQTTYADGSVQQALASVVPVKLDAERGGRQAAARYRVNGFPTILFLDATGREVARIPGYLPPEAFLEELRDILRRA